MLAGGLNQRIRENSYFFTIIYFTGSGEQPEGFEKRKLAIEEGALGIGHWASGIGHWCQLATVNSQPSND